MAFSSTLVRQSLMGNLRVNVYEFNSAGATGGDIDVAMGSVDHVSLNNEVTEGEGKVVRDGSKITLSGLVSNDTGTVMVVGI